VLLLCAHELAFERSAFEAFVRKGSMLGQSDDVEFCRKQIEHAAHESHLTIASHVRGWEECKRLCVLTAEEVERMQQQGWRYST
jgi:hypothetical protein